jgi:DNA-directed RNA polymerase beta' subunit
MLFITLELFQPFLLRKLIKLKIVTNIREGKTAIFGKKKIVNEILKKVIENLRLKNF